MAPRLVNPSPGRQVRKGGIKNSCTGRTRRAGGGGGLPGEQTGFADRNLFYFRRVHRSLRNNGCAARFVRFLSLAHPGATLQEVLAAQSPPAGSLGEHKVVCQ